MPYFKWHARDAAGNNLHGHCFARDEDMVAALLMHNQLSLLSTRRWWFYRKPSATEQVRAWRHIGHLLSAGIRLDQALEVVGASAAGMLKYILADVQSGIRHGASLSFLLECHQRDLNPLVVRLVKASEQGGSLATAFFGIADHGEQQLAFARTVRSALMMPLITMLFFCGIMAVLFIFIVPRFELLLHDVSHGQLPWMTQLLFSISSFVRSGMVLVFCAVIALVIIFVLRLAKKTTIKRALDNLLIKVPGIRSLIKQHAQVMVLETLALLLKGHVRLNKALALAAQMVGNTALKSRYECAAEKITTGSSLTSALQQDPELISADLVSCIAAGEDAGILATMVHHAAKIARQEYARSLQNITVVIQPVVLIVLGGLIAAAIAVLYLPLLTMQSSFGVQ